METKTEITTFGAGCFWCVEKIFSEIKGVIKVTSGYSGGHVENPNYKQVCSGNTGHAEVVQIEFDSGVVSFETLLDVFFHCHDPTTLNRQGNDIGTQYRSVIYYHSENQKTLAEKIKKEMDASQVWPDPIVTEISKFATFYPAEDYHQDYFNQNTTQSYCQLVINPKVQKFRKRYQGLLRERFINLY